MTSGTDRLDITGHIYGGHIGQNTAKTSVSLRGPLAATPEVDILYGGNPIF